MNSMTRNIKHWFVYQVKTAGITFGMIILMVAFMAFAEGGNFSAQFLKYLPMYLGMMATFSIIVNGFTGISVIFPITISFGATRKESIIAMALSVHMVAVVEYGCCVLAAVALKKELLQVLAVLWPGVIAVVAFVLFLGNLVSMLSNKFGRVAGMICYMVIVVLAVIAIVIGMVMMNRSSVNLAIAGVIPMAIATVAALIAIGLDVLSIRWMYQSVKTKDLTFTS